MSFGVLESKKRKDTYIVADFLYEREHFRKGNGRNNDKFHWGKVKLA